MDHHQPAGRIAWVLSLCTALSLLGDATLYAVLPSTYAVLAIGALQVGWLLSINRLVRLPLNLASGWLAEHIGHRTPYLAGLGLGALSTIGYGLFRGFWPLLLLRGLWGLSWSLIAVAAYALLLDCCPAGQRGRLAGLYTALSYFGGAAGAWGGGMLVDALGLPHAMLVLGGISLLALPAAFSLPRRPARAAAPAEIEPAPRLAVRLDLLTAHLRRLDARLWLILVLNMAQHVFFEGVFYATFGLYLLRLLGEQLRLGTLLVGIATLSAFLLMARNGLTLLVSPLAGRLSDRLGDRVRVLALGELLGAAGLSVLALSASPWLSALGVLLAAVAYGMVPTMLMAWLGDLTAPGERGLLVGAYQTLGDLGSGVGPLAAYALLAITSLPVLYGASAAILLLAVPFIWAAGTKRRVPVPLREAD
ncbi:MAG: MFS transporter [Anaerolineae bacterium]